MVVCKCRKATKLYCFVHKVPVCGECICFSEHQICEVHTYSEWVLDASYDSPSKCCSCQGVIEDGMENVTTRLGCLHIIHTNCLISHVKSFPPHTAPAGYVCPTCSTSLWPPRSVKDPGSKFHLMLNEAIQQSGLEKNIIGDHPMLASDAPSALSSAPLMGKDEINSNDKHQLISVDILPSGAAFSDIIEVDNSVSAGNYIKNSNSAASSATTRKSGFGVDKQSSENSYYADDEDGNRRKYTRRGPFRHKFLKALIPFYSSALPILPVSVPPPKDGLTSNDLSESRTKHQKSRTDSRKFLLFIAIMTCMATIGILYYRIAQGSFGEHVDDEQ